MKSQDKFTSSLKQGVLNNKAYTLKPIETRIKLNQNESPFDLSEDVKDKILDRLRKKSWNIYPGFTPEDIYEKVAKYLNINKENILLGNGSNEMIFTVMAAMLETGKKLIISEPTFTVYKLVASNLNAEVISILQNEDFSNKVDKIAEKSAIPGSLTVIASPNSPTGTFTKRADLIRIIEASKGIVVIDEAYIQFGGETVIDLINKYDNLIILRTFSKAFGLAGLRIGIMISNSGLITEMSKVKLPYNLNIFTLATLDILLDSPEIIDNTIKKIIEFRDYLQKEFSKINAVMFTPTSTNFFLVKIKDSKFLYNKLLEYDILVRDFSNYPMLDNCLRISVGNKNENELLIKALKEIYKE
ncbi:MAG: histidinol-phosphate transaminase [Spirochaetes bacterium]|nr:histidinol-phosphate transaminase [Spirochaetota bacterium]